MTGIDVSEIYYDGDNYVVIIPVGEWNKIVDSCRCDRELKLPRFGKTLLEAVAETLVGSVKLDEKSVLYKFWGGSPMLPIGDEDDGA